MSGQPPHPRPLAVEHDRPSSRSESGPRSGLLAYDRNARNTLLSASCTWSAKARERPLSAMTRRLTIRFQVSLSCIVSDYMICTFAVNLENVTQVDTAYDLFSQSTRSALKQTR